MLFHLTCCGLLVRKSSIHLQTNAQFTKFSDQLEMDDCIKRCTEINKHRSCTHVLVIQVLGMVGIAMEIAR